MKSFYLIDFENIGISGIENALHFASDSTVVLFSTKNTAKINIGVLSAFNTVNLKVYDVAEGSQSVDKHLLSYLGFLIGREGASAKYVVISKDTGYDKIIQFWKSELHVNITRMDMLKADPKNPRAEAGNNSQNKREHQIRCFFGQEFKEQKYREQKETIIQAVLMSKTKTDVNAALMKDFPSSEVRIIYGRLKPLLEELPGQ